MADSPFLNLVLLFVTVASIFSTFAEANRGFGWGWGGGSNYSSSSGSSPGSGWGWGSSRNGSGWIWGAGTNHSSGSRSIPGSGWSWGWGMGSNHSSGSGSSPWSGWGPNNGQNTGSGGSGSGWGWGPKNTNNSGSGSSGSGWGWGSHSKGYNATYNAPRKFIVGGDKEWTYGFNYSDWASKTAPFFLNDILVFKYNPPAPFTHSVYLFSNPLSYEKCDVKKGKMIASPKQGAGNGFELVLTKMKPYYISCGEHDGAHCSNGTMKFTVMPILARW
ncbi:glycine-rich cell wall structural protein 2 [Brassica napus]|uniref:glycine-rich cell wall structural protein 2 n=1 Tax=Brassica napus TaxID=3708 RepID=UPI0006AB5D6D|nr:glycine-rich cell wall structural protein 2 [Brassica napus]